MFRRKEAARAVLGLVLGSALAGAAEPRDSGEWRIAGQTGGTAQAVAADGRYVYAGVGASVVVLDPASSRQLGSSAALSDVVEDLAVAGSLVFAAAGEGGVRIVDVSDPSAPAEVGSWRSNGYAWGIAVSGAYAYVADGPYGLRVLDISKPALPVEVAAAYETSDARKVSISGNRAYLAAAGKGLLAADISNPSHPLELATVPTRGYTYGVAASGSTVYLAEGWEGVRVVDLADPKQPVEVLSRALPGWVFNVTLGADGLVYAACGAAGVRVLRASDLEETAHYGDAAGHAGAAAVSGGTLLIADRYQGVFAVDLEANTGSLFSPPPTADWVAVAGNLAFVAASYHGLRIVDISAPETPQQVAIYDTRSTAHRVAMYGNLAVVASNNGELGTNLQVIDASDPTKPHEVGRLARNWQVDHLTGFYRDLDISGDYAYLADESGLEIVSLSDPAHPARIGYLRMAQNNAPDIPVGVGVRGRYAYVACSYAGIKIVDVGDPANPMLVGQFATDSFAEDVVIEGSRVYVPFNSLRIFDLSDPVHPVELGNFAMDGADSAAISGDLAYVAAGNHGVSVLDVSTPARPALLWTGQTIGYAMNVALSNSGAVVADWDGGLSVVVRGRGGSAVRSPSRRAGFVRVAERRAASKRSSPVAHAGGAGNQGLASCTVTSAADSGDGTLRACITNIAPSGSITFDPAIFPPDNPATIQLATQLPSLSSGITLDASDAGVILDGSRLDGMGSGIGMYGDNNTVRGLQILNFPFVGIAVFTSGNVIGGSRRIGRGPSGQGNVVSGNGGWGISIGPASRNRIVGNLVGTDASGARAYPNRQQGILIAGGSDNAIGSSAPGEGNVISGNGQHGMTLISHETHDNVIEGNYIGTDASGASAIGNGNCGISIEIGSYGNTVRGNVVSGNGCGVLVSDPRSNYNSVVGNLVGLSADGRSAIGNRDYGIDVGYMGASFNRIGGVRPEERNVVSGNRNGLMVAGPAWHNVILGNSIGTDASSERSLGNTNAGIFSPVSGRTTIGGSSPAEGNIIAGPGRAGLMLASGRVWVLGNQIGADASGRGLSGHDTGVEIDQPGREFFQGNVIDRNRTWSFFVPPFARMTLRRNSIYGHPSNGGMALSNAITADAPAPSITAASASSVTGMACAGCEVEVYSDAGGEGAIYEGRAVATAAGTFALQSTKPFTGPNLTATATNTAGRTSQFSKPWPLASK